MRWLYSLYAVIITPVLTYSQGLFVWYLVIKRWRFSHFISRQDDKLILVRDGLRGNLWTWEHIGDFRRRSPMLFAKESISNIRDTFCLFRLNASLFIGRPSCYVMKIKPRSYINIRIIYRWVSMSNSVSGIYNILLSYLSLFVHRSSNPVTLMVWYGLRPLSGWIVDSSDAHFWRKYTSWFWLCDATK